MRLVVLEAGGLTPFSAKGFIDDKSFCFEYSGGVGRLVVSMSGQKVDFGSEHVYAYAEEQYGEPSDSSLEEDEFNELLCLLTFRAVNEAREETNSIESMFSMPS